MRKDILTESTMQSMNCGQRKTVMAERQLPNRQKNGRCVRMNYVWTLPCGWMLSFAIIIMCLTPMHVCRDFSEREPRAIIFF